MRQRSRLYLFGLLAALLAMFPSGASAQFDAAIEGTVADATGAVIPGAQVTVTNQDQGVSRNAETNASGYFRVAELPPGNYRVEVKLSGFNSWTQTNIILDARQIRTVSPTLEVGEVTTEVTVEATISSVNTASAVTGRELDKEMLEDAPLPGRAVWRQAALVPGVIGTGETGGSQSGGRTSGGSIDNFEPQIGLRVMAAGQRQDSNQFVLDGSYINEDSRAGSTFVSPFPDSVESFNVRANEFSAAKGRSSGVFFEVVTKSGTNEYHGSVAWWHTNNKFQSRSITDRTVPVFRRNEGWVAVGGPIVRNRTFFHFGFDILRSSESGSSVNTVETPEFVQFVQSQFPNSMAAEIFRLEPPALPPSANIQTVGQLRASLPGFFPNDVFPADLPAVGTTFVSSVRPRNGKQLNARVDHHFNDVNDRLFFYFYRTDSDTRISDNGFIRPDRTRPAVAVNYFGKVGWTHIFSPTLLNTFYFARGNRDGANLFPPGDRVKIPSISVTGLTPFGGWAPGGWNGPTFQWNDVIGWNRGNHNLQFGYERHQTVDLTPWQNTNTIPTFVFGNLLDFAQDKPFQEVGPGLNPQTGEVRGSFTKDGQTYNSVFFQDDWKVTRNFTLNLGVRWNDYGYQLRYRDDSDPVHYFTPGEGSNLAERFASGRVIPRIRNDSLVSSLKRVWGISPRFGFAWDIFGDGKTSMRGGYGMFHDRIPHNWAVQFGGLPFLATPLLTIFNNDPITYGFGAGPPTGGGWPAPPLTFEFDEAGGLAGVQDNISTTDPFLHPPQLHNFMFSLQRQLAGDTILELTYSGAKSTHLPVNTNTNRIPGDLLDGTLNRLNPNFGGINYASTSGSAFGHSISAMVDKRFSARWSGRAIYTLAKTVDFYSTTGLPQAQVPNSLIIDATDLSRQRGRADFDARHRFVFDAVYDIPVFSGTAGKALGGWRIAAVGVFQTGLPFTVNTTAPFGGGGDFNADGENYDVPNAPSFGNKVSGASRSDFQQGLFTAADFPLPTPGVEGDLGRNTFEHPGFGTIDFQVMKTFQIPWATPEGAQLELRGEFLNAFNLVNLTPVVSNLSSPLFGRATSSIIPRRISIGLRIQF